jgi:hypothetical protein
MQFWKTSTGVRDQRLDLMGIAGGVAFTRRSAAQRLWVQYRDANCAFYGVQDGSIRQVQAAECIRSMTEDRAHELEKAIKFD